MQGGGRCCCRFIDCATTTTRMWDLLIVRPQRADNTYNVSAWGWWDGGGLMMLPSSKDEGGAGVD